MYHGISKLAPAERMLVRSDGSVERSLYWTPFSAEAAAEVRDMSEAAMVTRVRDLLRDSIRKRMMSDVPFGVFLSGGVDSSANVALMAELMDQPVRTFATAPEGHARYDERSYARLVAERYKTDHHEFLIDARDMIDFLPQMIHHQDEPTADPTAVPQHFVSQLARENGAIVVQCGEGSDELFHGYKGYADHRRFVSKVLICRENASTATGIRNGPARVARPTLSLQIVLFALCVNRPRGAHNRPKLGVDCGAETRVNVRWIRAALTRHCRSADRSSRTRSHSRCRSARRPSRGCRPAPR
jgi:asparagine synthase (glutamine-hydrolysing)